MPVVAASWEAETGISQVQVQPRQRRPYLTNKIETIGPGQVASKCEALGSISRAAKMNK
jgi:hypothetical protein